MRRDGSAEGSLRPSVPLSPCPLAPRSREHGQRRAELALRSLTGAWANLDPRGLNSREGNLQEPQQARRGGVGCVAWKNVSPRAREVGGAATQRVRGTTSDRRAGYTATRPLVPAAAQAVTQPRRDPAHGGDRFPHGFFYLAAVSVGAPPLNAPECRIPVPMPGPSTRSLSRAKWTRLCIPLGLAPRSLPAHHGHTEAVRTTATVPKLMIFLEGRYRVWTPAGSRGVGNALTSRHILSCPGRWCPVMGKSMGHILLGTCFDGACHVCQKSVERN